MKKFTTLMATSAAVLGLAGSLTAVNADNAGDLASLKSEISRIKNGKNFDLVEDPTSIGDDSNEIANAATSVQDGNADSFQKALYDGSAEHLGNGKDADVSTLNKDIAYSKGDRNSDQDAQSDINSLGTATRKVLDDFYGSNNNDVKAPAQNTTTSSSSKANNDVKAPAQNTTTSSSSKANNDVKAPAQQATTSNSSKANNDVKAAAQNTTTNGAVANNNENTKVAGKTTTVDTQQANNNGIVSTTAKNGNANAVSTPAEMHQAAQQATSNTTAVPTIPQTGEQGSEVLAIAGGLVIAATAAGIVVYKKRN